MRPIELTLSGFQGYQNEQTIDFSELSKVAVTGTVGAGKTSIFDAMCFALYGATRKGLNLSDAISTHSDKADVTLIFEVHNQRYRVRRVTPRKGSSKMDFDRLNGEGIWEPCGDPDKRVGVTTELVVETINTTFEQFRATAFIEQEGSGTTGITTATPGERYAILSAILGLDKYDKALKAERAAHTALTKEKEALTALIDSTEAELVNQDSAALTAEVTAAADKVTAATKAVEEATNAAQSAQERREALQAQREADATALSNYNARIAENRAAVESAQHAVNTAEGEHRAAVQAVTNTQNNITHARNEKERYLGELNQSRKNSASAVESAQRTLTEIQALAPLIEVKQSEAEAANQAATTTREAWTAANEQETALTVQRTSLIGERDRARNQWEDFKGQIIALQATIDHGDAGHCSRCGQSTDPTVIGTIITNLKREQDAVAAEGKGIAERLTSVERELGLVRTNKNELTRKGQEEAEHANALSAELGTLNHRYNALGEAEANLTNTQSALAEVERELEAAANNNDRYSVRINELTAELETTQSAVGTTEQAVAAAVGHQKQVQAANAATEPAPTPTVSEQDWQDAHTALSAANDAERTAHTALSEANTAHALATAALERATKLESENAERTKRVKAMGKELAVMNESIAALSPSGIPQMLTNSAIDSINADMERLLNEISRGKVSAVFTTSRTTKAGTVENKLSLMCTGSEGGTREFATFSGGEKAMVKIAVHAALAKALKERSGTSIDVFCADEITSANGTQEDKASVVRALLEVVGELYPLMLLITHDADVVAAMPQQIEVTRTYESSVATVTRT